MALLKSVLLVDDDYISNFLNSRLIKRLNLAGDIKVAENGKIAFDYLVNEMKTLSPDLILLDINMPVMSGFDFLEALKNLPADELNNTRIIVLTSSTSLLDLQDLSMYSVSGFIEKPLTQKKILDFFGPLFNHAA
jgi:CheY-like chemotaxis protein